MSREITVSSSEEVVAQDSTRGLLSGDREKDPEAPVAVTGSTMAETDVNAQMAKKAKDMGMAVRQSPEGHMRHGSEFKLPEDSYGAAMLAIVKEVNEIQDPQTPITMACVVRCIFAVFILIVNVLLQFSCVYFIELFVVMPSVHNVQSRFLDFHRMVFDSDGNFDHQAWEDYSGKEGLCQVAMTNKVFYYTILLLWTVSCLQEFRTAQRLVVNISMIPHADSGTGIIDEDEDGEQSVVAITRHLRWALYLAICLPKIVISFLLTRLGLRWLSATHSFEDMVMNAIAMNFVVQIDELLYHFALPVHYRNQVAGTSIFLEEERGSAEEAEMKAYKRSFAYVLTAVLIVVLYAECIQDVLPSSVQQAGAICHNFLHAELQPICVRTWSEHLYVFTRGLSALETDHCYPYGQSVLGESAE